MKSEMIDRLLKKMELDLHRCLESHFELKKHIKEALENTKKKPNIFRLDLWYDYYQDVKYIKSAIPTFKKIRTVRRIYNKKVWELENLKKKVRNPWV